MAKADGRAVFLDRDGTVIHDVGYPRNPRQVRLLPGVGEALSKLRKHGFLLILVSNQSGIGRGLVMAEEAEQVHRRVIASLLEYDVELDAVYYCPHAPKERCRCRKPSPEMLLRAAKEFALDLARSFMVGDKLSDIEAGKRAGCRTILLTATPLPSGLNTAPHEVAADWSEVLQHILTFRE
jgi:D-glycero-D-manno-heptose 1,7-bisphosphate phosphatase